MFVQTPMAFEPGLYANRSRRASKGRWCDGDLIRFRDGVPAQIGGWQAVNPGGVAIAGLARGSIAWRPNNQVGKFAVIGTESGAFLFDGADVSDITPDGFVAGIGGTVIGDGFGSDRFGADTYGTPRTSTGNLLEATTWTFDMFGEQLLGCCSTDGIIYGFTESEDTKLTPIVGAPRAQAICVSDERHVFAFGADGDPSLVAWSDREDASTWDPAETNRAGGYQLQVTSAFQCGKRVRGQVLAWTKTEVFAFAPLNNAFVYSRDRISTEAGVIGKNAVAVVTDNAGEAAYWMGRNNFFVYDGVVRALDCELRDYVFGDINLFQAAKFHTSINTKHDEVWFHYCSEASDEIDRAVIYNFALGVWSKATIGRLTWIDAHVFDYPLAVDANSELFWHEIGDDADGVAMASYVVSHPITVGVGQQFAQISQFWPDLQDGSSGCQVSFLTRNAPTETSATIGPYDFAIGDEYVPTAFACREFQLRIDGGNGHWELGIPLVAIQGSSLR